MKRKKKLIGKCKNIGTVIENPTPSKNKMMVKIWIDAYVRAGNSSGSGKLREYLKSNAGKWVEVETDYLFSNQYNTKDGFRIYDSMITAIKNDARESIKTFVDDDECCFLKWGGVKPLPLILPNEFKIGTYRLTERLDNLVLENNVRSIKFLFSNNKYYIANGIGYKERNSIGESYSWAKPVPDNVKTKLNHILKSL